jgi:hypothetical protein
MVVKHARPPAGTSIAAAEPCRSPAGDARRPGTEASLSRSPPQRQASFGHEWGNMPPISGLLAIAASTLTGIVGVLILGMLLFG